jgi:hypothetical protein
MTFRKLEKTEGNAFFDSMSKSLVGRRVRVEVASRTFGTQTLASFIQLRDPLMLPSRVAG